MSGTSVDDVELFIASAKHLYHNLAHLLLTRNVNPSVSVERISQLDSVTQDVLIKKEKKRKKKTQMLIF